MADLSDGGGHRAAAAQFSELKGLTGDDVLVLCENVARPRKQRGKAEAAAEPAIAAGGARDGEARGQLENLAQETAPTASPLPGVVAQRTPPGIVLPAHLYSTSSRALLLRPSLQSRARSRRLGSEGCPRMSSVPELCAAHDLAPARASSPDLHPRSHRHTPCPTTTTTPSPRPRGCIALAGLRPWPNVTHAITRYCSQSLRRGGHRCEKMACVSSSLDARSTPRQSWGRDPRCIKYGRRVNVA